MWDAGIAYHGLTPRTTAPASKHSHYYGYFRRDIGNLECILQGLSASVCGTVTSLATPLCRSPQVLSLEDLPGVGHSSLLSGLLLSNAFLGLPLAPLAGIARLKQCSSAQAGLSLAGELVDKAKVGRKSGHNPVNRVLLEPFPCTQAQGSWLSHQESLVILTGCRLPSKREEG